MLNDPTPPKITRRDIGATVRHIFFPSGRNQKGYAEMNGHLDKRRLKKAMASRNGKYVICVQNTEKS